jgi:hypothetical protein
MTPQLPPANARRHRGRIVVTAWRLSAESRILQGANHVLNLSLTPRLQPGGSGTERGKNRFNGFEIPEPKAVETAETKSVCLQTPV